MMADRWLVACAAALALTMGSALAADAAAPARDGRQAVRQARVASGERVPLADPKLDDGQLSVLRPGYRNLRPKARGNAE